MAPTRECTGRSARSSRNAAALRRAALRAVAVSVLTAAAFGCALLTAAAFATPATAGWGPDSIQYRAGIVCAGAHGSSVLASWPSAATRLPAYALTAVTSGPDGAHAAVPAVDAPTAIPYTGSDAPALAALLANHGRTAGDRVASADVAAAVLHDGGLDQISRRCLAAGTGGASSRATAALWSDAARLAGPYTVRVQVSVAQLELGTPAGVSASVTSASGAGVPGVRVDFGATDAQLAHPSAVTDADGLAHTRVTASNAAARAVRLAAHAQVPGTPVTMTAPGAVPLVAAGPTRTVSRSARITIDTTADPQLALSVDHDLVLPGDTVHPSLAVTGLRGHAGSIQLALAGPLPLSTRTGCHRYEHGSRQSTSTQTFTVTGDKTVRVTPLTLTAPGCYVLSPDVATTNAVPNVRRTGQAQVVAVAPVHVTVDPAGHGVSPAGRLTAGVRVSAAVAARLVATRATLLGPRSSDDGSCTAVQFPATGTAMSSTGGAGGVHLSSDPVSTSGCYGVRVAATVDLAGLGSVPVTASATTLVVAPAVSVTGVSADDVIAGEQVRATVSLSGTWHQPGAVRLDLLHLPYDWRGCYDRDWTHATRTAVQGPASATTGDGTYRVDSGSVPAGGCWSVVPVLVLSRNHAVSVGADAPVDPMTAFLSLPRADAPHAGRLALRASASDHGNPVPWAIAGMVALLFVCVCSTVSMALRDDR